MRERHERAGKKTAVVARRITEKGSHGRRKEQEGGGRRTKGRRRREERQGSRGKGARGEREEEGRGAAGRNNTKLYLPCLLSNSPLFVMKVPVRFCRRSLLIPRPLPSPPRARSGLPISPIILPLRLCAPCEHILGGVTEKVREEENQKKKKMGPTRSIARRVPRPSESTASVTPVVSIPASCGSEEQGGVGGEGSTKAEAEAEATAEHARAHGR
jgi:hypothetical protein